MNFVVDGGKKLSGNVVTSRSKNGAVALLAASLLNRGKTTLKNVPKIEEVNRLIEVLQSIGVSVEWSGTSVIITPPETFRMASACSNRLHLMNFLSVNSQAQCPLGQCLQQFHYLISYRIVQQLPIQRRSLRRP